MICYGINDIYRKKMYKYDNQQIIIFFNELNETEKQVYLRILLTDGYQILKRRNSINDDKHTKKLYSIISKSDFNHIKDILEDNYQLLQVLFINAKLFMELPIVDRCLLLESQSNHDEYIKLLELNPLFLVDMCVYSLQKDISSINYYYKDYLDKLGSKHLSNFISIVLTIMTRLKEENRCEYDNNFLEILKGFYINHKFMNSLDETFFEDTKIYSQMLETEEIADIEDILSNQREDFVKIISLYLAYQSDLASSNDTKRFIDDNISKEMIKKLKIDNK